MPELPPTKRKYNSSRRQAQARETGRLIVDAARQLLIERGYTGTTMEQIAQKAGVAVETLYASFGSKRAMLSRVLAVALTGDDESVPLLQRPGPQAVRQARDQRLQVEMFAHDMREIMGRVGPVLGVMRTAAEIEPDIAELLRRTLDERLQGMKQFVLWVASNGPLRGQMTVEEAAETVWAITSAELHQLLTVGRGWSADRYEVWLRDTISTLLIEVD